MSDLTAKFTAFETQSAAQHDIVIENLEAILNRLDAVNVALDIITNNNATNTRYLLQAIGELNKCVECGTQPIIVPPIDTTPVTLDTDKCKRSQAFVDAIGRFLAVWDTFSSFDVASNVSIITNAISEVIGELGAGDTIPLPSFPEAVQLAGDVLSFTGYNLFAHTSLVDEYNPLKASLYQAIYDASDRSSAQSVYNGLVAAGMSSGFLSDVVSATAYNELWNYYFDPDSLPDLSGYSGVVCGTAGCFNYTSETACANGFCRQYLTWGDPFTAVTHEGGSPVWDKTILLLEDLYGARIINTGVATKRLVYNQTGGGQVVSFIVAGGEYIFTVHTDFVLMDDSFSDGAFSIQLCTAGAF